MRRRLSRQDISFVSISAVNLLLVAWDAALLHHIAPLVFIRACAVNLLLVAWDAALLHHIAQLQGLASRMTASPAHCAVAASGMGQLAAKQALSLDPQHDTSE